MSNDCLRKKKRKMTWDADAEVGPCEEGRLGRFDIGSLVLVFITGGGLMSAATRFVELLATTFGEQRYAHRASMVEDVSRKDV